MSLRVVVAAPFRRYGSREIGESDFIVDLSLDRDWYTPDQVERVLDLAAGRGLLERDGATLRAEFDPDEVRIPDGFEPDEDLLQERSPFECVLDELVAAGLDKQEAVADINRLQADLAVTIEAAAALYARRHGIDVGEIAVRARCDL